MTTAVIPNMHRLSQGLKNVGVRCGVRMLFCAPNTLSKFRKFVERQLPGQKSGSCCNVKHTPQFIPCSTGIVCPSSLLRDDIQIGQSGRCINAWLMEHRKSLQNNIYARITRNSATHTPKSQVSIYIVRCLRTPACCGRCSRNAGVLKQPCACDARWKFFSYWMCYLRLLWVLRNWTGATALLSKLLNPLFLLAHDDDLSFGAPSLSFPATSTRPRQVLTYGYKRLEDKKHSRKAK